MRNDDCTNKHGPKRHNLAHGRDAAKELLLFKAELALQRQKTIPFRMNTTAK